MQNINTSFHCILSDNFRILIVKILKHYRKNTFTVYFKTGSKTFWNLLNQLEGSNLALKSTCVHRNTLLALETFKFQCETSTIIIGSWVVSTGKFDINWYFRVCYQRGNQIWAILMGVFLKEICDLRKGFFYWQNLGIIIGQISWL